MIDRLGLGSDDDGQGEPQAAVAAAASVRVRVGRTLGRARWPAGVLLLLDWANSVQRFEVFRVLRWVTPIRSTEVVVARHRCAAGGTRSAARRRSGDQAAGGRFHYGGMGLADPRLGYAGLFADHLRRHAGPDALA